MQECIEVEVTRELREDISSGGAVLEVWVTQALLRKMGWSILVENYDFERDRYTYSVWRELPSNWFIRFWRHLRAFK